MAIWTASSVDSAGVTVGVISFPLAFWAFYAAIKIADEADKAPGIAAGYLWTAYLLTLMVALQDGLYSAAFWLLIPTVAWFLYLKDSARVASTYRYSL